MKFTEILEELKKGEKVTREKWEKPSCTIDFIVYDQNKGKFMLCYNDNYHSFVFLDEDIIAEDWKIYKEKENNRSWKPKEGDTIFYITETGRVISGTFLSLLPSDNDKVLFNNAFKTAEEAEHMVEKIKIINKLRELSNINFNDTSDEAHYAIAYDVEANEITFNVSYYYKDLPFNIYFATEEALKKAVETIGEDNLKKYYFDIKDNQ